MITFVTTLRGTNYRVGNDVMNVGGYKNVREIREIYEINELTIGVYFEDDSFIEIPYHAVELIGHNPNP